MILFIAVSLFFVLFIFQQIFKLSVYAGTVNMLAVVCIHTLSVSII